jgi:hypothetical protein
VDENRHTTVQKEPPDFRLSGEEILMKISSTLRQAAICVSLVLAGRIWAQISVPGENAQLQQFAAAYYANKHNVSLDVALQRLALQDQAAGIEDVLAAVLGEQYAGIWYDHDDRGRLKIGMTRLAAPLDADVRRVVAGYNLSSLADLVPMQFSLAELLALQDAIRTDILDLIRAGHAQTGYDTKLNRVVVRAIERLPGSEDARIQRWSTLPAVTVLRINLPDLFGQFDSGNCNVTYCDPPLRGGREIISNSSICTGAFIARHRVFTDVLLMLTAGHCVFDAPGSSWSARDEAGIVSTFGPNYGYYFPGRDAGAIEILPLRGSLPPLPSVVVKGSANTTYDPNYQIRFTSLSNMGQLLCQTGRTTGTLCAEVSGLGTDHVGIDAFGGIYPVHQMGELDQCLTTNGDSGAPVYKKGRAYGIVSGSSNHPPIHCNTFYQGIRGAQDLLDVDILLAQ